MTQTLERKPLAMVAAMAKNRVIGKDGGLPWHHPEDLKHFMRVTKGHAIIMGRATYDSVGKPLKDRRNIIVSRDRTLRAEGCEVVDSLERALELAREHDEEPRIIGGAQLYALALPLATRMWLTYLDEEYEGDTYFPEFDPNEWQEVERWRKDAATFVTLERR